MKRKLYGNYVIFHLCIATRLESFIDSMAVRLPDIGTRISLNSHAGTVKFIGHVENSIGTWIGVEWDDPARGKHDGCKDGKRYFNCR